MSEPQRIADIKPFQKAQDSIFAKLINRRVSRVLTFYLTRWDKSITPSQVTMLSFVVTCIGCALLMHPTYWWRLVGALFLQLGFTLDCCDGEIARLKNNGSKYGSWLDSVMDRLKECLMLGALTLYWYIYQEPQVWVLLIGFFAIIGLQIVSYLREAKKSTWPTDRVAEIFISKDMYLGTVDATVYLVCFSVLVNYEIGALVVFLLVSIPLILKQFRSAYKQGQRDLK